jgi:Fe-S-cluster containining protein
VNTPQIDRLGTGPAGIPQEQLVLLNLWSLLEKVHRGYDSAASEVSKATGARLCVPGCGLCCHNSVLALGIEAELAASWLLGQPKLFDRVMDACYEWLTRPGKYTYGGKLDYERWQELLPEYESVLREPCPFLLEDRSCLIHWARPLVCRAYGVTRMPAPNCPRPLGFGEGSNARAYWDGRTPMQFAPDHKPVSLYQLIRDLKGLMAAYPRYSREGFFTTFLYERFRAKTLAGLLDDGKVPMVKVFAAWGGSHLLLWQEQLDQQWKAEAADKSIAQQVPMERLDGLPVMTIKRKK